MSEGFLVSVQETTQGAPLNRANNSSEKCLSFVEGRTEGTRSADTAPPSGEPQEGPPTGGRPRLATSADLARVAGRVAVAPALPSLFRCLHTHFIELQPAHTLEQVTFLVLAKQRWNVSEACRPLDDAAHPTHSANLRSGSVCRSC
jgi:hypothetical protein